MMTSNIGIRFGDFFGNNCGNRAEAVETRPHGGRSVDVKKLAAIHSCDFAQKANFLLF